MDYAARAIYSGLTLYMMLILLRWLGGWITVETDYGRWRWVGLVTDPLVGGIRRRLPNLGPVDFGPIVAILAVWLIRGLSLSLLLGPSR